jgi:hypothetical protein
MANEIVGMPNGIADWRMGLQIGEWDCRLANGIADRRMGLRIGECICGMRPSLLGLMIGPQSTIGIKSTLGIRHSFGIQH